MSESLVYFLAHNCPKCGTAKSVAFDGPELKCSHAGCDFRVGYSCPLCEGALSATFFGDVDGHLGFHCGHCGSKVAIAKVKYLIENGLYVDHQERCDVCNGPTIHKPEINLSNRCFFFPQCSGQADLFGSAQESVVFLDFETSGLEIGRDSVIEIGALKIDNEGAEHTFQHFVRPLSPIDEKISKYTGITNEMVADAMSLKDAIVAFSEFLGDATLVSHNADFDVPWLLSSCIRHEIPFSDNKVVCTLVWSKNNHETHCSLGALSKKYSISHRNSHRALADSVTTKELYFIFQNQKISPAPEKKLSDYRPLTESMISRYSSYVQA